MSVEDTLKKYDLFDNAIWNHGFTDYMRDYRIVAGLNYGEFQGDFSFLFLGCVEANYEIILPEGAFSMDDALINPKTSLDDHAPFGFDWDVRFADVYPG